MSASRKSNLREDHRVLAGRGLHLRYGQTHALNGADIQVNRGEIVALTGKSGSGKSSLLYCLAGIVRPDEGQVHYLQDDLMTLDDDALSECRRTNFGFVFQFGELVPELSIYENVSLPLRLNGVEKNHVRSKTDRILKRLGIDELAGKRPNEVSGGQAQRAAVARALVHEPDVVFADEPTGSLDSDNAGIVLEEFIKLAREAEASVVLVTHEEAVAAVCDRNLHMTDGKIHQPALAQ